MKYLDQPLEPDPVIEAYKKDIDRTLLDANLKLSPEQRLLKLMEMQRFAEELRRAGQRAREEQRAAGRPKDLEAIAELEALRDRQ
jgi:hypothetical protein